MEERKKPGDKEERGRVVDAGEQDSYAAHTEAALESLNVIRLKGF